MSDKSLGKFERMLGLKKEREGGRGREREGKGNITKIQ